LAQLGRIGVLFMLESSGQSFDDLKSGEAPPVDSKSES
jgi:hypothetical protein